MVCHTALTLRAAAPAEVALPPQEMIDAVVAWDPERGVHIVPVAAAPPTPTPANDAAPSVGRGLVQMPDMTLRGVWGRIGLAPDDADALMRGLAGWAVAFAAAGAIIRWA